MFIAGREIGPNIWLFNKSGISNQRIESGFVNDHYQYFELLLNVFCIFIGLLLWLFIGELSVNLPISLQSMVKYIKIYFFLKTKAKYYNAAGGFF